MRQYYGDSRIDIEAIVKRYLDASPRMFGPEDDRSGLVDLNTDTFPRESSRSRSGADGRHATPAGRSCHAGHPGFPAAAPFPLRGHPRQVPGRRTM